MKAQVPDKEPIIKLLLDYNSKKLNVQKNNNKKFWLFVLSSYRINDS